MEAKQAFLVIEIQDSALESLRAYNTQGKAEADYKRTIKSRYPWLKGEELKQVLDQGFVFEENYAIYLIIQDLKTTYL
jgi:hypothetical protein